MFGPCKLFFECALFSRAVLAEISMLPRWRGAAGVPLSQLVSSRWHMLPLWARGPLQGARPGARAAGRVTGQVCSCSQCVSLGGVREARRRPLPAGVPAAPSAEPRTAAGGSLGAVRSAEAARGPGRRLPSAVSGPLTRSLVWDQVYSSIMSRSVKDMFVLNESNCWALGRGWMASLCWGPRATSVNRGWQWPSLADTLPPPHPALQLVTGRSLKELRTAPLAPTGAAARCPAVCVFPCSPLPSSRGLFLLCPEGCSHLCLLCSPLWTQDRCYHLLDPIYVR